MAATITVAERRPGEYRVEVKEDATRTSHDVRVAPEYARRLTGGVVDTATLVRRSFEFLLERESKESILGAFELPVIARYFPEYEREIRRRLGG